MTKELEALQARNAELEDRIEKLEKAAKPPEPFVSNHKRYDPTEGMTMPKSAMRAMALPDGLMNDLRADSRKPNPINPPTPSQPQPKQRATPNWVDERPLEPPPGIEHVDRLVSHQDRLDRAERAFALAKARMLKE
jgi:hypothetical protein